MSYNQEYYTRDRHWSHTLCCNGKWSKT